MDNNKSSITSRESSADPKALARPTRLLEITDSLPLIPFSPESHYILQTFNKLPRTLRRTQKDGIDLLKEIWSTMEKAEQKKWTADYEVIHQRRLAEDRKLNEELRKDREETTLWLKSFQDRMYISTDPVQPPSTSPDASITRDLSALSLQSSSVSPSSPSNSQTSKVDSFRTSHPPSI
ncbi:hypothetical protein JCM3765_000736 [Sporobolomyces pararoseus]